MRENPKLREDLVTREVESEFLVYDPETGEIYLLNGTAAGIAEMCDGTTPVADIVAEIVEVFGADPAQVAADVESALADLRAKGLLEEG